MYEIPKLEINSIPIKNVLQMKQRRYMNLFEEFEETIKGVEYLESAEFIKEKINHHLHPNDCICDIVDERFIITKKESIEDRAAELKVLMFELTDLL